MTRLRTASTALLLAAAFAQAAHAAPQKYAFDKAHTNILFAVGHHGISTFYGQFNDFDGNVIYDREDPTRSSVEVTIKAASIDTDVAKLDEHLRSPDFFETDKYPTITFKSTRVQKVTKNTLRVTGDLTMHGKTREVALDARLNFDGTHPLSEYLDKYKGAYYTGFSAKAEILRSDFDVSLYTPAVSDLVQLILEVELRRQ